MGKFEEIATRLKIAKKKTKLKSSKNKNSRSSNLGSAFKMSTELVSAVVVSSFIGFILDTWFDTKPWLIITFFFIGVAAGIINVVKSAKAMQR